MQNIGFRHLTSRGGGGGAAAPIHPEIQRHRTYYVICEVKSADSRCVFLSNKFKKQLKI